MNWQRPNLTPSGNILCIIIVNHQICADLFVWNKEDHAFLANGLKISFDEIQAWCPAREIPKPEWMQVEMQDREDMLRQSMNVAKEYRDERGDLFGKVVDPDDIAEGRA